MMLIEILNFHIEGIVAMPKLVQLPKRNDFIIDRGIKNAFK